MLPILTNFKLQLQANKAKSFLLGALLCVAAILGIRGLLAPQPRMAAAGPVARVSNLPVDPADADGPVVSPQELKEKLAQSKVLWQVLREKRGVAPAQAFAFDATYYNLDPSVAPPKPEPVATPVVQIPTEKSVPRAAPVPDDHARMLAVKEQAKSLILKTTVLGSQPGAIINTGVFHIDDHVEGFRIVAIRAREVIVEKDGITLAIEMAK